MALQDKYTINGFVDTSNNVWDNIERMAAACGAWPTFDTHTGKFSLVINQVTPSTFTFDESNLLSEITFATSEGADTYNEGEIKFANQDQFGKFDSISQRLLPPGEPAYSISPNEYPNKLGIQNEFINNSVQADYVLAVELKQSRRDRIITFDSDYSAIGVQAGDVVTVTVNEKEPFLRNQEYRVIEVQETDGEDGSLILRFTAVDYFDETYDFDLLIRTNESVASPVPPIKTNEAIETNKDQDFGGDLGRLLTTAQGLFENTFEVDPATGEVRAGTVFNDAEAQALFEAGCRKTGIESISRNTGIICGSGTVTFTVQSENCSVCFFNQPTFEYDYSITGLSNTTISIAETGTLNIQSAGSAQVTFDVENTGQTLETLQFTVDGVTQTVQVSPVTNEVTASIVPSALCEGGTVTVTLATVSVCDILDASYIYEITGVSASDIDIPLTGTFSSETLTITTQDDADVIDETMTVTIKKTSGEIVAQQDVLIRAKLDFTYSVSAAPSTITEGDSSTVTLTTTNLSDGTVIPYEITGLGTGRVTTPLTGNVTVNSNTADLIVNTADNSDDDGNTSVTVTFDPDLVDPCGTVGISSTSITILDDDPAPPPDYETEFVQIPLIYKGIWDGETQYLKSIQVVKYAWARVASTGGLTVPLTVSVTGANTAGATVTIDSTVNIVDDLNTIGGSRLAVITAFDAPPTGGGSLLTGTINEFYGYVN